MFKPRIKQWLSFPLLALVATPTLVFAENADSELWEMPLESLGKIRVVSIASGTETPLSKAAAVTSVILAEDIKAMGATDLDEILETVPGLHVNHSDQGFTPKYVFRGITSRFNPQALMLVNGVPVTSLMFGNRGNVWGGMPVKSIQRIEVIRGPGSALYGADAFAGVINIITKDANDIDGVVTGARAGSFNTKAAWLEAASNWNNTDISLVLEQQSTDGWERTIERDAQTYYDTVYGSNASLAPGPVNKAVDQFDARLDIQGEHWVIRAGLQDRRNAEMGPGVAQALDPNAQYASQRINIDASYHWEEVLEDLDVESQISFFHFTQEPENNTRLFPAGAFGGAFPDGMIGNPGYKERQARFNVNAIYNGINNHRILTGVGALWGEIYEVTESKNFNVDYSYKGEVVDVSDNPEEVWMPEKDRKNYYLFVQDEWQFSQNWQLVSGLRYDYFADFGESVNPRVALIWATTDKLTSKLLYGRAFRSPSLNEQYVSGNPILTGNDELNPETIDTVEIALAYQATPDLDYGLNLFYYETDDLIDAVPISGPISTQYENKGGIRGHGGEFEVGYQALRTLSLTANYAYQTAKGKKNNESTGNAPNHQVYGRAEWQATTTWALNTQINWVGEQKRPANDDREPVDDYTTVDFVARSSGLWYGLDVTVSVRNAFNADVRSPSIALESGAFIPGDYPMPGRWAYIEAQYQF